MPLEIVRNDITKMKVDAIVNAANSDLQKGGGVCGAIFAAAGAEMLQAECDLIGRCDVGEAVLTSGGNLPAGFIIHTAGPVWHGGHSDEERLLRSCYANSLALAAAHGFKTLAFPLISSGIYGYPKDLALAVAVSAIGEFLLEHELMVYLAVYDKASVVLSENLFSAIAQFIDDNYVDEHQHFERNRSVSERFCQTDYIRYEPDSSTAGVATQPVKPGKISLDDVARAPAKTEKRNLEPVVMAPAKKGKRSLEEAVSHLGESFSQRLLRLIDEKGLTDVETYRRANIDRKLFSKVRGGKDYNPSKATAIAFAIALKLNFDDTRDLLGTAGYFLSSGSKFDVIIAYFIEEGVYSIHEINEALFAFHQPLLGA